MISNRYVPQIIFFVFLILSFCICGFLCLGVGIFLSYQKPGEVNSSKVGFDFDGRIPQETSGDNNAASHVFIHQYPFPLDGFITGVEYMNDADRDGIEKSEAIYFLLLRPVDQGYQIIYRQELPVDDFPPVTSGTTLFDLPDSIPVKKGDVYATWQPENQNSGPIPLNLDAAAAEGFSIGKAGFGLSDTEPGRKIGLDGFSGRRDYFIRVIYIPGSN
jgi:hypothetical protein